jgi:hypothetical protein
MLYICSFIVQHLKPLFFFFFRKRTLTINVLIFAFCSRAKTSARGYTSKYLQENWYNRCLETVLSIVIISLSAVFMSCVRIIQLLLLQTMILLKCVWTVCVYIVWNIKWSMFQNIVTWVYVCLNSVAGDCSVFGHITFFCTNLFLWGVIISSLLPSRPHFGRFFFSVVVTYQ